MSLYKKSEDLQYLKELADLLDAKGDNLSELERLEQQYKDTKSRFLDQIPPPHNIDDLVADIESNVSKVH